VFFLRRDGLVGSFLMYLVVFGCSFCAARSDRLFLDVIGRLSVLLCREGLIDFGVEVPNEGIVGFRVFALMERGLVNTASCCRDLIVGTLFRYRIQGLGVSDLGFCRVIICRQDS
jgi:hypothetical protein